MLIFSNLSIGFLMFCLIFFPEISFSATFEKDVCFNFYIVTKKSEYSTEINDYELQKKLALIQMSQAQKVFKNNQSRNCPIFNFSKGVIKHIVWDDAIKLSKPVDQKAEEKMSEYLYRKLNEATNELHMIINKLNEKPNIKYRYFMDLRPGKAIVKAEKALKNMNAYLDITKDKEFKNSAFLDMEIKNAKEIIKLKLNDYDKENNIDFLKNAEAKINDYEKIDNASAQTWANGELTLWNDIEAQNTSVELKNLLKTFRTTENKCLDVYVVPSAKSPSINVEEVEKNGRWTRRDGAAISSKNFPRTTAEKGDAILLSYHSRKTEFRLAHEFAHLLLDKVNAHLDKKETDLMHEFSRGGYYLDEIECDTMTENAATFFVNSKNNNQSSR